jgi:glycerate 2-kinase
VNRYGQQRVVVAPDSLKSTLSATAAADAIARGLLNVRPDLRVDCRPQADGGEGTLDAILDARPDAIVHTVQVTLPTGRRPARWLMLGDGTAVVELAECCGLPAWGARAPMSATTAPLGVALLAACESGANRIVLGLGGSAATDGGMGCLRELGLKVYDESGCPVPEGGAGLLRAVSVDASALIAPPRDGTLILCDVNAPLFGEQGAAVLFAPQKGADTQQVALLDRALRQWAALTGGDASMSGSGAAGGTSFGLTTFWSAALTSGASYIAELTHLERHMRNAALVITAEGCHDQQSTNGKSTGYIIELAERLDVLVAVIAGRVDLIRPGVPAVSLTEIAQSTERALADPVTYLTLAAERLAATLLS